MLPVRRKYLYSFEGKIPDGKSKLSQEVVSALLRVNEDQTDDRVIFNLTCPISSDFGLCGTSSARQQVLRESVFALVFVTQNPNFAEINHRVYEALQVQKFKYTGVSLYGLSE
jgi:hypothetical protein